MSPERLTEATLRSARAALPTHDRRAAAGIAHLGLGAFARAHLALYADDLLELGGQTAMIRGVSLHDTRPAEMLAPQDGLYTVVERDGEDASLRVVGSLASAATGPVEAVRAVAALTTWLVTLTVTEKGYDVDDHDRCHPELPRTAVGVLVAGLAERRAHGVPAPVVASLDNVTGNGEHLQRQVLELAGINDPELARWIDAEVRFPCSVVDRMVPAATPEDVALVTERMRVRDEFPVVAEPHRSWVVEAVDELASLEEVGVAMVDDIGSYERRKLWLLNGPHSAYAYAGLLSGCATIAEAAVDPIAGGFVQGVVADILEVVDLPASMDANGFSADVLRRFANQSLKHRTDQVAADGSKKLPLRVLPVVAARERRGLDTGRLALVVAAWMALVGRADIPGVGTVEVPDPCSATVADVVSRHRRGVDLAATVFGLGVFGSTEVRPAFVVQVGDAVDALRQSGARALGRGHG